ncbi:CHAT domain-containing protein [Limnofasciculus baicalensis]|uniref:CHAT domain-containing protein n=1 Tax=Limnofasciculus baicalensis BBK-W-15 TaxID=2699891 RepID=A0AAE3GTG4_9CYAN|nr:CHAT domain-containing protein [Limnofasciculus baicalensis]MCP2729591.1 CHAT domain-containing protein [Limnofasciculus baicalensis BBK-W-15]
MSNNNNTPTIQQSFTQDIANLEQQARQLYEAGELEKAVEILKQIATEAANHGDKITQARIQRNLALVYQKQGKITLGNEAIAESLKILETGDNLINSKEVTRLLAQTLEVQGELQLALGESQTALETWKKTAEIYQEIEDIDGINRSKINQAQALQKLGLYRQAIRTLTEVGNTLKIQPDSIVKAKGLQSLGEALRVVGMLTPSQEILQQSLAVAEKLQVPDSIAATLISLGNVAYMEKETDKALDFYQRAAKEADSATTQIQANLNQLRVFVEQKQLSNASVLANTIKSNLDKLTPSQNSIYARINLAESLIKLENKGDVAKVLATALAEARSIQDKRGESYALGSLGELYEENKQWEDAQKLTQEALILAQVSNAADIAYRWQWQLGRILRYQKDREGAIASYTEAVKTLKSLRSDLVAVTSDVQFSFRESVEPVYRQLVALLLEPNEEGTKQEDLAKARATIESLQLAELDNFFRDACIDAKPAQIDNIDQTAAIFYPIILKERLEVILALPGQPLRNYSTPLPEEEINKTLNALRDSIIIPRLQLSIKNLLVPAKQLYDWLISPVAGELAASGVKTLVFVPDGAIRNVPLSALYDGKQYLIEKYSIAIAPGLQLIDPQPLVREKLNILAFGLSEARQNFAALPNVKFELENIQKEIPGQVLLDEAFTNVNFQKAIESSSSPVVHLATHGEFSSDADNTFVLAWDERIPAREFAQLLRNEEGNKTNPIELLVLSACQTAEGDNRAALGLAGVAVRAGARSTLASLWFVSDRATSLLMSKFYQELTGTQDTKAESLRQAQLSILQQKKFAHPYYWAAFILVGNWL